MIISSLVSIAYIGMWTLFFLKQKKTELRDFFSYFIFLFAVWFTVWFVVLQSFQDTMIISFGYGAIAMILLALNCGPLQRITRLPVFTHLRKQRRNIGVAGFLLGLGHYLTIWNFIFMWNVDTVIAITSLETDYSEGIKQGLALLFGYGVIALISNTYSMKLLKRWWKRIQLVSYPLLLLVFIHLKHVGQIFSTYVWVQGIVAAVFIGTGVLKAYDFYQTYQKSIRKK